jgi:hypothetical protein
MNCFSNLRFVASGPFTVGVTEGVRIVKRRVPLVILLFDLLVKFIKSVVHI